MILALYIARHVLRGGLLALLVLTSIELLLTFAGELPDVGTGSYQYGDALLYTLLTAPRRAYDALPMAAVTGALVTLGELSQQNEFVVMRAAGVSTARLTRAVLLGGTGLALLALLLGEAVTPYAEPEAQNLRAQAKHNSVALRSQHGVWARDGQSFVNIRRVLPGQRLEDLSIYEFDDNLRLRAVTRAARAEFKDGRWLLSDLRLSQIGEGRIVNSRHPAAAWEAVINPELINVLAVKAEQLSLPSLLRYLTYLRANGLDAEPYEFALWGKLMHPLATLVMLVFALPFVLAPARGGGAGQRLLIGILTGIGYLLFSRAAGHLGQVYDLSPLLSSLVPTLLFLAAGFAAMRYVRV
jgi:lipopolysaccharide export system permease protein